MYESMPFSVLICVYKNDKPEYFDVAFNSIIAQSKKPNEIILVVDGPITVNIDEVIRKYESDPIFKIIRLPENVGHGNARRIGINNCSYELIALMDADDISIFNRFEKQLRCFEEDSNLSIVGSNIIEFYDNVNNVVGVREVPQADFDIKAYMKKRCPFNQPTVMFKKTEVEAAGGYIDWFCDEDYFLWIRMLLKGSVFKNLNECLVNVRVGKETYQRRGGWKYFKSEAKLQKYMLKNKIINFLTFTVNVFIRLMVQVLMPNNIRSFIFKKFARKHEIIVDKLN